MHATEGMGKFDRDIWTEKLAPILSQWEKLNKGSNIGQVRMSPPSAKSSDAPISWFVTSECYSGLKLISTINANLAGIKRVLKGTALLTSEINEIATDLLKHQVNNDTRNGSNTYSN